MCECGLFYNGFFVVVFAVAFLNIFIVVVCLFACLLFNSYETRLYDE